MARQQGYRLAGRAINIYIYIFMHVSATGKFRKVKGLKSEQVYAKARAAAQRELAKVFGSA